MVRDSEGSGLMGCRTLQGLGFRGLGAYGFRGFRVYAWDFGISML